MHNPNVRHDVCGRSAQRKQQDQGSAEAEQPRPKGYFVAAISDNDLAQQRERLVARIRREGIRGLRIGYSGGRLSSGALELRMQPSQMRRLQLSRPSAEDVKWLLETLNREGRKFGTRVHLAPDNKFDLEWRS